jgi:hypothetical protein
MRRLVASCVVLSACCLAIHSGQSQEKKELTVREGLARLGDLVGSWKGTGVPTGTKEEQEKGFWTEVVSCEWQFKMDDAWLKLDFARGKYYVTGEIRYVPAKDEYRLRVTTTAKTSHEFTGTLNTLKTKVLTFQRQDAEAKEEQKLVFTMLHENRILYRYEVKPEGKGLFFRKYQVGANREGVAFATGDGRPECVVSGGLGTMAVSYMGATYYVCCSGCRDEFRANPKKYVDEYEAKLKKKAK